jgi:hypothetical protein
MVSQLIHLKKKYNFKKNKKKGIHLLACNLFGTAKQELYLREKMTRSRP